MKWMTHTAEKMDEIMKQLEEERDSRSDPDDPFNSTANGVFQPLQDPLSLPPPVQTPKNKKTTVRIQNLLKIRGKMAEDGIQRDEMREYTKRLSLRKESHGNFENILENRRTRWRVFEIYIFNQRQNRGSVQN